MKAIVVMPWHGEVRVDEGQEVEIVGFVFGAGILHAVWRDDLGFVWSIPATAIRMLPRVTEAAA